MEQEPVSPAAPHAPAATRRTYLLAAGGTGGHMIPAHALAEELIRRGHHVVLVTDARGQRIPGLFEGASVEVLPAGRIGGGLRGWIRAGRAILAGRREARQILGEVRPAAVVGFGGYPALPSLLAALSLRLPTLVHEQNAVLGRVNRLLARRVDIVATAYGQVDRLPRRIAPRVVGNPVRAEILALRDQPYPPLSDEGIFRVLVTGGSQGASILSTVVPDALGLLPIALRQRLQVTQQCRPEDIEAVRARYAELDIACETATYIADMPGKLAWTHLFVGRSGASTIAELTAAGRPAILVPLPSATDDHQTANAREMAATGGAAAMPQSTFTPQRLAKQMQKMALQPGALENAARRAKEAGYPNATADLADLVESLVPPTEPAPARAPRPPRATKKLMAKEAFA